MPRIAPVILAVAVWIYGVIDCAMTPENRMPRGLSKPIWLLIILLVPVIGALAWLGVKWVAATGRTVPGSGRSTPPRRPKRKGPMAPDDDPEFLANLDWQARKAHYERQKRERAAQEAAAGETPVVPEEQTDAPEEAPSGDVLDWPEELDDLLDPEARVDPEDEDPTPPRPGV
ncbi:MAG: PLD nuclease N-terminal domain-containing protein [bacterium]|nr:PLD nuclease N-terminal domain-containing protein [bacterium]